MSLSRRHFLARAGAMGMIGTTGLGSSLMSMPALAANTTGYKAIVCLFLFGGMDSYDAVLPYDSASYSAFADIRPSLLNQYASNGAARDPSTLLRLNPDNAADLGGREFALPPEMPGLHAAFESGNAAIMANVGPLLEPTNRTAIEADTARLPRQLFSHNDQQSTWMASAPEGAQFGWGGRFADLALASNANNNPLFTAMSAQGNTVWLSGEQAQQYQLSPDGPPQLLALQYPPFFGVPQDEARALLEQHFRNQGVTATNLFERDVTNAMRRALDSNAQYAEARDQVAPITTEFPRGFLGDQLRAIAESISLRGVLGASRQVYFAATGGFDTHSAQATDMPGLQGRLDAAITAFTAAMAEIGASNDVTLFTASDFGRTLSINGDGTDHGWGAHQFVIGGAVNGRRIYGEMPQYGLGHEQEIGNGRLIPTTSVEQFAAPLGRWFGLSESELNLALPGLSNFSGPGPGLV
ncbi:DUF1501 domain-containing protein [Maricaulis sp.]|uniref:DUF1501 domain-containing protein n=1 Tax=Maricaulis sp. TaxID=1486257 RepID=UPI0026262E70|nr:DUF1501 domain-containing protein [Maricaulis sp.]